MTDEEIEKYLKEHNYEVNASDCIRKVFNTSNQIISTVYDFSNKTMTITTHDKTFVCKWLLNKIK
jgi:hypothetical protein